MKTLVMLLSLFALSSLNASQEFPQRGLPEGVKTRIGKGKVTQIEYSPDGARLAVGTGIGIWIYDTMTAQDVAPVGARMRAISGIWAYSPDGSVLASGGSDNTFRLWDASTGAHLRTLEGHTSRVISVIFSGDGDTLASVDDFNTLCFWDTVNG